MTFANICPTYNNRRGLAECLHARANRLSLSTCKLHLSLCNNNSHSPTKKKSQKSKKESNPERPPTPVPLSSLPSRNLGSRALAFGRTARTWFDANTCSFGNDIGRFDDISTFEGKKIFVSDFPQRLLARNISCITTTLPNPFSHVHLG